MKAVIVPPAPLPSPVAGHLYVDSASRSTLWIAIPATSTLGTGEHARQAINDKRVVLISVQTGALWSYHGFGSPGPVGFEDLGELQLSN